MWGRLSWITSCLAHRSRPPLPQEYMMDPLESLRKLVWNLPGRGLIDDAQYQSVLELSLIPDDAGHWPGTAGYAPTYDVYFAAYLLVGFLQAQPQVTTAGSEGTSVTSTVPDWPAMLRYLSGMSAILRGRDVLQAVRTPDEPHIRRTDMSGRGDYHYGDVDTDIG